MILKLWFHGTNEDAAENILRTGFRSGTYFASHLEDALAFGGPHVFEVALEEEKVSADATWQLHTLETISTERIIGYTRFTVDVRLNNMELRKDVFETRMDGSVDGFACKVGVTIA